MEPSWLISSDGEWNREQNELGLPLKKPPPFPDQQARIEIEGVDFELLLSSLPGTRACPPSRVGCRCAGTFQPVHRSRAEAAARCRSTAAAGCPGPDRTPPAPVWFLVRFPGSERRRRAGAATPLCCCQSARLEPEHQSRLRSTPYNPAHPYNPTPFRWGGAFRDRGECGSKGSTSPVI